MACQVARLILAAVNLFGRSQVLLDGDILKLKLFNDTIWRTFDSTAQVFAVYLFHFFKRRCLTTLSIAKDYVKSVSHG